MFEIGTKIVSAIKLSSMNSSGVRLPHEYQEVEYIESTGTQYIDTGYNTTNDIKIEARVKFNRKYDSNVLFGTTLNSWSYGDCLCYLSANRGFQAGAYDTDVYWTNGDANIDYEVIYTLSSVTLNLDTKTYSVSAKGNRLTIMYGNTLYSELKLYSFKIYTGTTLIRDFVPCYRVSDGTVGLYDLVEGKFYTNSGTGTFTKGAPVNVWQMPNGYTELAYIQSTGTQYIDTGIIGENKYIINTKFMFSDLGGTSEDIAVIASTGTSRPSYMSYIKKRGVSGHYWSQMVGSDYSSATWSSPSIAANTEYTVEAKLSTSGNYLTVNGTQNTWSYSSDYNTGYSMYIFASNNGGTVGNQMKGKIFYLKIYDLSNNLIRDYVPCMRDSDGVIGMYDLVTKQFFTNSGSGDFVAGPVVFRGGFKASPYTKLYVKMNTDLIDHSGKDVNITNSGVTLNTSVANVGAGYFDGNSRLNFPSSFFDMSSSDFTISFWCRDGAGLGNDHGSIFNNQWTLYSSLLLRYSGTKLYGGTRNQTWDIWSDVTAFDINQNTWVLWTVTRKGSEWKIYKNNALFWSGTSSASLNYNSSYTGAIGGHEVSNPNYYIGYISDFIVEQGAWTDQQREDYFNATKVLYGIS